MLKTIIYSSSLNFPLFFLAFAHAQTFSAVFAKGYCFSMVLPSFRRGEQLRYSPRSFKTLAFVRFCSYDIKIISIDS